MPGTEPCSTSRTVILEVAASGYLPHLPFDDIVPLGPHDSGCTSELQLQLHWLALDLLVGDDPGAENHDQLQFGIWLVALPARGDHDVPGPNLTGWLMRLIEFCDGFYG